jgi:hypothetical protein
VSPSLSHDRSSAPTRYIEVVRRTLHRAAGKPTIIIKRLGSALQAPIAELSYNGGGSPVAGTLKANERNEIVRALKVGEWVAPTVPQYGWT